MDAQTLATGPMALGIAEELLEWSVEHEWPLYTLLGSPWRGWALAARGKGEEGIVELERAKRASAEMARLVSSHSATFLG